MAIADLQLSKPRDKPDLGLKDIYIYIYSSVKISLLLIFFD